MPEAVPDDPQEIGPRRATFNLTARGNRALHGLVKTLECNDTDAVNRGLAFAHQLLEMLEKGGTLTDADGTQVKIIIT